MDHWEMGTREKVGSYVASRLGSTALILSAGVPSLSPENDVYALK